MVNLKHDIPVFGAFSSLGAVGVDLLLHGGDMIVATVVAMVTSWKLWLPVLSTLRRLAPDIPIVTQAMLTPIVQAGTAVMLLYYLSRWVRNSLKKANNK